MKARPAERPLPAKTTIAHTHTSPAGVAIIGPFHIPVGGRRTLTPVTAIRDGNHIALLTGHTLLHALDVDPTIRYQPLRQPTRNHQAPPTRHGTLTVSDVLRQTVSALFRDTTRLSELPAIIEHMNDRPYGVLRLARLREIQLARAALDAEELRLLAALSTDPDPYGDGAADMLDQEWVRDEIACILRIAPATASERIAVAAEVVHRLPVRLRRLAAGELHLAHVRRLTEAVRVLPDPAAREVEQRVLARAGQQSPAQFAAAVRRAVLAVDPRRADERRRAAEADCRVVFTPQPDGVTELWALLPAAGAAALQAAIDAAARQLDLERPADLRRADALVSLATGSELRRDGGQTSIDNLHPLCRRHHRLKHRANWRVRHDEDGTTIWRAPTGRRYRRSRDHLPRDATVGAADPAAVSQGGRSGDRSTGPPAA